MSLRAKWDVVLGVVGYTYVILILVLDLSAPFFSLVLIGLVAHELFVRRNR